MQLEGRVALITGGSRGIGRAISARFAAMGAVVAVNYVGNHAAAEKTCEQIRGQGGTAVPVRFNVGSLEEVQTALKEITATCGPVEILVNNAGITRDGLSAMLKEADWDSVLDTNLKGAFLCCKAVMRTMMKKRWGRIINIGSVIGATGNAGQVNYAAAKAGLTGLTKSLARELAPRGITVNCIAPGYVITEMTEQLSEDIREELKTRIPLGTLGTPEQIAACAAFLASEDAAYVTGQTLHVNGGMYMGN
ncbi:MAG: 3-oxoacyl-[acyl-carrier-protein] reductase [Desulfobulbus propionicus]|nr:MAG: 3-oxoacyl-[acyl-carrier-protein] reductase [Desulfobulbus propionicus]